MRIDIVDLKKTPGTKIAVTIKEPLELEEVRFEGPVTADLRLANAVTRLLVHGTFSGNVRLACSRCAEDFNLPLSAEIDEEFLPASSPEVKADEDVWSALNVYDDDDEEIDLTEILRQNALASLPIQPLCSEDCKGLCATCGENLNRRQCGCVQQEIDPRWQPLLDIKARHQASKKNS
jgi:uncharacterized protein